MATALLPSANDDEAYRLAVLRSLDLLDTPAEAEFDAIVQLAQHVLGCPIALISLVDLDRQWFKARQGFAATESPREISFCDHAIRGNEMLVVPDATRDPRFRFNPLVTAEKGIRFYAGVPLRLSVEEGSPPAAIGALCVIDTRPRTISAAERAMLLNLAAIAERLIRGRMHIANALRYDEERRDYAARIRRQNLQLAQAERIAGMGSWRMTLDRRHLEWSDQVYPIYGLPPGSAPPLGIALDFYPPQARAQVQREIDTTLEHGTPFDFESDFVAADGKLKRVRCMGELEVEAGVPVGLIGVFQDITERHSLMQKLRRSAHEDSLTGIANRAGFNATLDERVEAAHAAGTPLGLFLIDLDGFKQVNDAFGHLVGDELLQRVARRLASFGTCFPARLGGDEFALILSEPGDCNAVAPIIDRLLAQLARPARTSVGMVEIAGTLGLAWLEPGLSRRELMHRADLALYDAKRAGKGICRSWVPAAEPVTVTCDRRTGSRR